MKISFPMLVAVLVLSTNAHGRIAIIAEEFRSCGAWTEERGHATAYWRYWKPIMEGWVLGFVSGANIYVDEHPEILEGVDARAINAWIDNYCRAHPLEPLRDAALELVKELNRRAGHPLPKDVQP
jgi:hypothetical protein